MQAALNRVQGTRKRIFERQFFTWGGQQPVVGGIAIRAVVGEECPFAAWGDAEEVVNPQVNQFAAAEGVEREALIRQAAAEKHAALVEVADGRVQPLIEGASACVNAFELALQ